MSVDLNQCNETYTPGQIYIQQHTNLTIGQWYWGSVAENITQGAVIMLAIEYYRRYPRDDIKNKLYVALVAIASILKTVDIFAIMWYKLILSFGNWELTSLIGPWYSPFEIFFTEFICLICQLFFIFRLFRLLGNNYLVFVPFVPALGMAVGGNLALSIELLQNPSVKTIGNWNRSTIIGLTGILFSDVVVTTSATYYLVKSKTGYTRTDSLIHRLLHIIWASALPPAIAAALNLILYLTISSSGNSAYIAFNIWMPKLYCVSVLYTMNSRGTLMGTDQYQMNSRPMTSGVQVSTETAVQFSDAARRGAKTTITASKMENSVFPNEMKTHLDDVSIHSTSAV